MNSELLESAPRRGPVMATLLAAVATIWALALAPGSLTSHADADTDGTSAGPPGAGPAAPPVPATSNPATSNPARTIQVIGHGGGSDSAPQNTLTSLRHSLAAGVSGVEFDVRFTSDREPVVVETANLADSTSCAGSVSRTTWAKVSKCRVGASDHVPSLDQVLALVASGTARVYVDVKAADRTDAREVMSLINSYRLNDPTRLTVIAPNAPILELMRRAGARDLGLVFGNSAGWHSPYHVYVLYGSSVTPAEVADAQRRGHFVIVVEGHPTHDSGVAALHLDGYMANRVDVALRSLTKVAAPAHPGG